MSIHGDLAIRFQGLTLDVGESENLQDKNLQDKLVRKIDALFSLDSLERELSFEDARDDIRSLEAIDPDNVLIHLCSGEIHRLALSSSNENKNFERLVGRDVSYYAPRIKAIVLSRCAWHLRSKGDTLGFQQAIQQAFFLDQNDPFIMSHYGLSLNAERPVQALQYVQRGFLLDMTDPDIRVNHKAIVQAELSLVRGRADISPEESNPQVMETFFSLSYHEKVRRAPQIEAMAQHLASQNPRDPLAPLCHGEVALVRQDFVGARSFFSRLYTLCEGKAAVESILDAYINARLGWLLLYNAVDDGMPPVIEREPKELLLLAQGYFSLSQEIRESDPLLMCSMSECSARGLQPISRSELILKRAFARFPEDPFVVLHYAMAHINGRGKDLRDIDEAKKVLSTYEQEHPGNMAVNFLLGELANSSEPHVALQHYTRAIETPTVLQNPYGLLALLRRAKLLRTSDARQAHMDLALVGAYSHNVNFLNECLEETSDTVFSQNLYNHVKVYLQALQLRIKAGANDYTESCSKLVHLIELLKKNSNQTEVLKHEGLIQKFFSDRKIRRGLNMKIREFLRTPDALVTETMKEDVKIYAALVQFYAPTAVILRKVDRRLWIWLSRNKR